MYSISLSTGPVLYIQPVNHKGEVKTLNDIEKEASQRIAALSAAGNLLGPDLKVIFKFDWQGKKI
ncbi:hypothetical protein [Acinetobacter phage ABPH49]|nr:hypothetical protein [Acinetobacter phage ABPH49]